MSPLSVPVTVRVENLDLVAGVLRRAHALAEVVLETGDDLDDDVRSDLESLVADLEHLLSPAEVETIPAPPDDVTPADLEEVPDFDELDDERLAAHRAAAEAGVAGAPEVDDEDLFGGLPEAELGGEG